MRTKWRDTLFQSHVNDDETVTLETGLNLGDDTEWYPVVLTYRQRLRLADELTQGTGYIVAKPRMPPITKPRKKNE